MIKLSPTEDGYNGYSVLRDSRFIGTVRPSTEYRTKWEYLTIDGIKRGTTTSRAFAIESLQSFVDSPLRANR